MNFIRRFVNRLADRRNHAPIRRRLTLRYDFGWHRWIVISEWTGEVCDLKEIRKVFGLIRDFYKSEEYAMWVQIYNAERGW